MALVATIIIAIICFVIWNIILFLLRKYFPTASKVIQAITLVFVIVTIAFSVALYFDARNFTDHFQNEKNIFVLREDNTVLAAIELDQEEPNILLMEDIHKLSSSLALHDYRSMKGDSYKMFLVDMDAIMSVEDFSFEQDPLYFDRDESIRILTDDEYALSINTSGVAFEDYYQLRGLVFSSILSDHFFGDESQEFMVDQIRDRNLIIYPENLMFKAVKWMPSWLS